MLNAISADLECSVTKPSISNKVTLISLFEQFRTSDK